ncbi:hypothetical protein [Oecophyllibacter saccharovorans]|uniref:hypothetical protein n=1 Tax=Oecophyllibacter saccharovorans TaxID=2558360 RepID=UPI0011719D55|nr:hypothetical protein [Oecophyllibacter saccharovorans]TPW35138.1 hypothetical protein E3203_06645 [Oecophyllibacter saccharovorans]
MDSGWIIEWAPVFGVVSTFVIAFMQWRISWAQKQIAGQQQRIADEKLQLDLFNRRYDAWENFRKSALEVERIIREISDSSREIIQDRKSLLSVSEIMEEKTDFKGALFQMKMLFGQKLIGEKCEEIYDFYEKEVQDLCQAIADHNEERVKITYEGFVRLKLKSAKIFEELDKSILNYSLFR